MGFGVFFCLFYVCVYMCFHVCMFVCVEYECGMCMRMYVPRAIEVAQDNTLLMHMPTIGLLQNADCSPK